MCVVCVCVCCQPVTRTCPASVQMLCTSPPALCAFSAHVLHWWTHSSSSVYCVWVDVHHQQSHTTSCCRALLGDPSLRWNAGTRPIPHSHVVGIQARLLLKRTLDRCGRISAFSLVRCKRGCKQTRKEERGLTYYRLPQPLSPSQQKAPDTRTASLPSRTC